MSFRIVAFLRKELQVPQDLPVSWVVGESTRDLDGTERRWAFEDHQIPSTASVAQWDIWTYMV